MRGRSQLRRRRKRVQFVKRQPPPMYACLHCYRFGLHEPTCVYANLGGRR